MGDPGEELDITRAEGRLDGICCKFGFYLSIAPKLQKLMAAESTA
jgi:hypothetical protein